MAREQQFLSRVRAALATLGPAERKLGDLVADFPGELASYNASELAALAGVSNATVTRFVRRLGYASYEAARVDARQELVTGSRLYAVATTADTSDTAAYISRDSHNISQTLGAVDMAQVDRVGTALLGARKVWVVGYRASAAFSAYLHWQLTQVIESIVAIPGPGQTMGEHLASMRTGDMVVFFAMRRRTAQTGALLRQMHSQGVPVIIISDEGMETDPQAFWHVHCQTSSPGPLFSHTAVMGLCSLIANRTILVADRAGRIRLAEIERLNDVLDEL
ncbi:MAG: MurR/RpiR family transcriptional regulator [Pseudotabrizicola sp.]|uniref:MurR/RpiR family transcriptional regulator n=1 Tax=Paracoccaceae TaxID=31989 RepID=UPI002731F865|nr:MULTISPECIES: MurR/RpiR family transcriptional regulator [Paracoccaceae]MDP2079629.1 MurR/RpiR family transcriptional regulator [Pseudotabrizicola sp.]MDZ4311029.1 MurR/RpiR family transcriptional regulator [Cypionkella sp.]MDZ7574608.1 MurR/RpiR family transcriptional regulator [Pseudotabrizicola sp.]